MDEKMYTVKSAAQELHYSERQIRQMCIDGKLPGAYKIPEGRKWIIPESAINSLKVGDRKQQWVVVRETIEQKGYEETPHKEKMRTLARKLADSICLPSLLNAHLWRDLPADFQPGKYRLPVGVVEIGEHKQMRVNYCDVMANLAAPYLVKALCSHFETSELPKFAELVGDVGNLDKWVAGVGQYSEALMTFLKTIAAKVTDKANVNVHGEEEPGVMRWFITTVWVDAIQRAGGHSWIDDSWYKPPDIIPNTNLWKLDCGTDCICIVRSKKTLKTYEKWHMQLRLHYAKDPLATEIVIRGQEVSDSAQEIRQRLQEFADMARLPGHCELCSPRSEVEIGTKS